MTRFKLLVLGCAALCAIVPALLLASQNTSPYPEAATIGAGVQNFQQLSDRFQSLARQKGALYAYDILRRAVLPPGSDVHLLGHTVGDELYKQKGLAGIADCTQEFRNACSHAIVIGALNEFGTGDSTIQEIRAACKQAPGGTGAYTMCFHGLGHGVFAYFGYDIPKSVAFCKRLGTPEYHDQEYVQCVGGMIMELIDGGGHDHDQWVTANEKYLNPADPLAPCSTGLIPGDVKGICYTYLTPHLFEAAGGNLADPRPQDFAGAFTFCDEISRDTPDLRQNCFAGIGKEFPVIALSRDIRSVDEASDGALQQMRTWCALAPHEEAYNDCTRSIVSSLYWGGENDPHEVIEFCQLAAGSDRDLCFSGIFDEAQQYPSLQYPGAQICGIMPSDKVAECRSRYP